MTAARFMRTAVRRKLVELIGAESGGAVRVERGFPGPNLQADQIWITGTEGSVTEKVFAGKIRPTDDTFTVSFLCIAGVEGRDVDQAEEVAEGFATMVMNAVHDSSLDNLEAGNSFVIQASLGDTSDYSEGRNTGYAAFCAVDVAVHTRTRYTGADAQ